MSKTMDVFNTPEFGSNHGESQTLECPDGHYITKIHGRSGGEVTQIGIGCSDGSNHGPYGGTYDGPYTFDSQGGFTSIGGRSGGRIDNLTFIDNTGRSHSAGGSGGGLQPDAKCNPSGRSDGKLVGFNIRSGSRVDRIGGICGYNFRDAVQPTDLLPPSALGGMDTFATPEFGGNGGAEHLLMCNDGQYVKEIYGRGGGGIDTIGIRCSDRNDSGEKGGRHWTERGRAQPFNFINDAGFTRMETRTGGEVDHIAFEMLIPGRPSHSRFAANSIGDTGGGQRNPPISCRSQIHPDGKIVGFKVKAGSRIDKIGAICGHTFRKNCNADIMTWDKDCDGTNSKIVVNSCSDKSSVCFAKRVAECKNASVTNTKCINFCKNNSGKCDDLMTKYCLLGENEKKPECKCLNSPALDYNPICIDGACINSGYATQGMIDRTPCPSVVDCRIYNQISETGRDVEFTANIQQTCGGPAAPTSPSSGSKNLAAKSGSSSWSLIKIIIVILIVVQLGGLIIFMDDDIEIVGLIVASIIVSVIIMFRVK